MPWGVYNVVISGDDRISPAEDDYDTIMAKIKNLRTVWTDYPEDKAPTDFKYIDEYRDYALNSAYRGSYSIVEDGVAHEMEWDKTTAQIIYETVREE